MYSCSYFVPCPVHPTSMHEQGGTAYCEGCGKGYLTLGPGVP